MKKILIYGIISVKNEKYRIPLRFNIVKEMVLDDNCVAVFNTAKESVNLCGFFCFLTKESRDYYLSLNDECNFEKFVEIKHKILGEIK